MTNLGNVLKSKAITLLTEVQLVKAMVFPVVMHRCESWTIKKAESRRTDSFILWCRRRLLRVPWSSRRWNQSILKEINREYSLEGLMLKLKFQYFGHLMWRADSLKKDPDAGKNWGQKGKGKTEDKMVGWHDQLSGQVFEQTLEDDEGQRNLACYGTCGHNAIQHLNNNLIYDKCLASYNYLLIKWMTNLKRRNKWIILKIVIPFSKTWHNGEFIIQ